MASPEEKTQEKELPGPWKKLHAAIWLFGLAIIALRDWWWPGILFLVAISGLVEYFIRSKISREQQKQKLIEEQADVYRMQSQWLPGLCPNCGGPLSVSTVNWTGSDSADCPYCSARILKPPREFSRE